MSFTALESQAERHSLNAPGHAGARPDGLPSKTRSDRSGPRDRTGACAMDQVQSDPFTVAIVWRKPGRSSLALPALVNEAASLDDELGDLRAVVPPLSAGVRAAISTALN